MLLSKRVVQGGRGGGKEHVHRGKRESGRVYFRRGCRSQEAAKVRCDIRMPAVMSIYHRASTLGRIPTKLALQTPPPRLNAVLPHYPCFGHAISKVAYTATYTPCTAADMPNHTEPKAYSSSRPMPQQCAHKRRKRGIYARSPVRKTPSQQANYAHSLMLLIDR